MTVPNAGKNVECKRHSEKQYGSFLKSKEVCNLISVNQQLPSGPSSQGNANFLSHKTSIWKFIAVLLEGVPHGKQFKCSSSIRRRQWHPTPVLLPGESHGQKSLEGYVHGVTKSQTRLSNWHTFQHKITKKKKSNKGKPVIELRPN